MNSGKMWYEDSHFKNREIMYMLNALETDTNDHLILQEGSLFGGVGTTLCSKGRVNSGVRN